MNAYSIQEISEMFHLPASTLRYYEEMGLLTNVARTAGGKRIYSEMHVNRLRTICCFKKTSMTISQLKAFFTYENEEAENIDAILTLLTAQKESVAEEIHHLQKAYEHILRKLHYYGDIKKCIDSGDLLPSWENYKYESVKPE